MLRNMFDSLLLAPLLVLFLSVLFAALGLGGASIYVPIFYWMGLPLESAIISGLFINVLTTAISSYVFHRNGLLTSVDYKAASFIFAGALIGAPVGVAVAQLLPSNYLLGLFAFVLLLAAARMYSYPAHAKKQKDALLAESEAGFIEGAGLQAVGGALRRVAMGGSTGVLSGTLGIGGGVFLVPFLIDSGVHPRRAAVLSHVCTLFASLIGLAGHLIVSSINLPFMLTTGVAAAVGSAIGSHMLSVGKISGEQIKLAFVLLLVIFSIKLALDALGFGGAPTVLYD